MFLSVSAICRAITTLIVLVIMILRIACNAVVDVVVVAADADVDVADDDAGGAGVADGADSVCVEVGDVRVGADARC